MGLLSIACLSPRLSIIFLPRSVDVVEQRHGERHAQELWRKREGDNEFGSACIVHAFMYDICVTVWSFWCPCPGLLCVFRCAINPVVKREDISVHPFSQMAFKCELWNVCNRKENVQCAQALSRWRKLRCHWIKVASYLFEVSITLDTSTSNTVTRLILKLLSGKVWVTGKLHTTVWCIVFT